MPIGEKVSNGEVQGSLCVVVVKWLVKSPYIYRGASFPVLARIFMGDQVVAIRCPWSPIAGQNRQKRPQSVFFGQFRDRGSGDASRRIR